MIRNMIDGLSTLRKRVNTSLRRITGGSDYKRWGNNQGLSPSWDSRTERIANLVKPGSSVIEFGAGRLVLKANLPEQCSYTPSDIVDRGEGTIICDLNSDTLPQFESYDVAVFSGVLEYVNDIPRLLLHLSNSVDVIIASYAITDTNKSNRRAQGWVNDYSAEELVKVFNNAGFNCECTEQWQSQMIYKWTKRNHI